MGGKLVVVCRIIIPLYHISLVPPLFVQYGILATANCCCCCSCYFILRKWPSSVYVLMNIYKLGLIYCNAYRELAFQKKNEHTTKIRVEKLQFLHGHIYTSAGQATSHQPDLLCLELQRLNNNTFNTFCVLLLYGIPYQSNL